MSNKRNKPKIGSNEWCENKHREIEIARLVMLEFEAVRLHAICEVYAEWLEAEIANQRAHFAKLALVR